MSLASAQKFLDKVKTDEAFAKAVRGAATAPQRMTVITGAGFDFTQQELDEVRKGELSDEELDSVAGGGYMCMSDICQTHK